jgi:hypothetical protein
MVIPLYESRHYHQVNLADSGAQNRAAVVDIGSGRYIVVWEEATGGPVGTSPGVDLVGQIFNADGSRFGSEFQVNTAFAMDDERDASLASRPGGGFVMVYEDTDASGTSIRVQTRDVNGALVAGTPVTIQLDTNADTLSNPVVAAQLDGSYLVAYNRLVSADGTSDVVGRIVSAAGVVGAEFDIFDSSDFAADPDIDVLSNGNYVIVFRDADDATLTDYDPQFQIRNASGVLLTQGTIDGGANVQLDVHVAALKGGHFVAVWYEGSGDGSGSGIRARLYNNDGTPVAPAFTVNAVTFSDQGRPDVAATPDGGFFVSWHNENADTVSTRRFDATGTAVTVDLRVGDLGANPTIASLADGRIVVAMDAFNSTDDIGARIFAVGRKTDDFNCDVRSDILWRNDDGTVATWDMNGSEVLGTHSFGVAPSDWHLQGTDDFNGDGRTDMLWRQQDTGLVGIWHMNGGMITSMPTYAGAAPEWHVEGTGDFNGDQVSDILWRHSDGTVGTWHMFFNQTVLSTQSFGAQPLDWHIEGTGDFNGDGKTDILWRQDGGDIGTWHMNGAAVLSTQVFANSPNTWHIEGTGDFNGDGKDDILWRHDDGTVGTWHMNGATVLSTQTFANAPLNWHIEGTGDYNGDGNDDILWRADDGTVGVWHMRGATVLSTPTYAPQPSDWQIVGNEFAMI